MEVHSIFGPPGTGKTAELIERAKKHERGLYLSYTRAAAAEAVSRLSNDGIRAGTIHSLAFNALGMNRASVVDKEKLAAFSKETGIPFKGVEDRSDEECIGDQYLAVLSFANNRLMKDANEAYDHFGCPGTRPTWDHFLSTYGGWKKTFGYMDFDDMLLHYAKTGRGRAPVVFVDEAQDSTPLQWKAIGVACADAKLVYVAGDDDQAVYEWSGADPHGMVRFMEEHKGQMTILAKSHRLPKAVHNLAVSVIGTVDNRVNKAFNHNGSAGEVEAYGSIITVLNDLGTHAPEGALILARDRWALSEMQKFLNQGLLPYDVYGGMSPWTSRIAKEIKDGKKPIIPWIWRDFYDQADLSLPIKYHLSTIHAAKGREHDTVIMNLECPARVLANIDLDRDAEVRVQYVGLTRARQKLILCGENPIL